MHKIALYLFYLLFRVLPYEERYDKFLNYIKFIIDHKRKPRNIYMFNDVLYHIKNTRESFNPLRQFVSDKELVKIYVKAKVGDKYNVPTLAVFHNYQELLNYVLPDNCCIKPTQASQAVILRKNGEKIDISCAEKWFDMNYYKKTREQNYKYLQPKIIVEPLIFDSTDLQDYRFFCFEGKVKLICIDIGKFSGYQRVFYTKDWEKQDFSLKYPLYDGEIEKPSNLDEMMNVAEKLAEGFDFIRIDMYSNGYQCLVGEITNCHAAASQNFIPLSAEKKASKIIFGDLI